MGGRDVGKKRRWKRNDMNSKREFTNWMEVGIQRKRRNVNA